MTPRGTGPIAGAPARLRRHHPTRSVSPSAVAWRGVGVNDLRLLVFNPDMTDEPLPTEMTANADSWGHQAGRTQMT
jgi:hypothetical protein